MKPFSLQTVLKYRKQMENKAINRLAEEERKKTALEQQYRRTKGSYLSSIATLERLQNQPLPVTDYIRYEQHIQVLAEQLKELKEKLSDAENLVLKARNHVLTKSKEKKIMEKLRDKQNLSWRQYLDKKETEQMDEIAVIRHDSKK